jgi:hypothetical protein
MGGSKTSVILAHFIKTSTNTDVGCNPWMQLDKLV